MSMKDKLHRAFSTNSPDAPGLETCNGCAVCTLSCPVWNQTHDQLLTFCGRMRCSQGGGTPEDLRESISACVLCGSCEPICSYGMDTQAKTIALRAQIYQHASQPDATVTKPAPPAMGSVLLACHMLMKKKNMAESALKSLGKDITLYQDNGQDISDALETGQPISDKRIRDFMHSLSTATLIITTDGLLYRLIKTLMPELNVAGLGEALIKNGSMASRLREDDLYIVDSRTYHANFKSLAPMYDALRAKTRCMMNLDLHRVATPTGATLHGKGLVDPLRQARWILEGRPAKRVIVENMMDRTPFIDVTEVPVLFISELY